MFEYPKSSEFCNFLKCPNILKSSEVLQDLNVLGHLNVPIVLVDLGVFIIHKQFDILNGFIAPSKYNMTSRAVEDLHLVHALLIHSLNLVQLRVCFHIELES